MELINNLKKKFSKHNKRKVKNSTRAMRSNSKSATPPKEWWRRWIWYLHPQRFRDWWFTKPGMIAAGKITGVFAGLMVVGIIGLFLYFAKDLPSPGQINARRLAQTTRFYDRTGEHILYEVFGDQNRSVVELENISDHVKHATIAIEDKNFYSQGAFSASGLARAIWGRIIKDPNAGGGSTITQQYVKNALLSPEQTYTRKIKELILSIQIEQLYKKDDILELYLNEIPYGAQAYGAQAASQMFFSKDAKDVTLAEAAMLAALPQLPTYYSPYGQHTDELVERQQLTLDLMLEQGYITEEEHEEAKKVEILEKVNSTPNAYRNITAPHFVLYTQELLEEKYGTQLVTEGGLEIITTLDYEKQKIAEKAVRDGIINVENGGGNNAALVAANPDTGEVMAMVGSRNFNHPKFGAFNAATALRQPGSSFKPYVYATAFKSTDWGPGSILYDVRTDFGGGYIPNNFDNSFRGVMTVRKALAESRNIPAVKMLYITGMNSALETAHEMGITTLNDPSNYGLSLVLGAGEVKLFDHVNAYGAFANGGIHHDPVVVRKITDPNGDVLEEFEESEGERVLDPQIAYLISDMLSDDIARSVTFGANNPNIVVSGHTVAVKTGSTDELKDGWMMGYSRSLVAGVWAGHNDNQPMGIATSNMTGPIFTRFMSEALKNTPNQPFQRPEGIKEIRLDAYTGNIASNASKSTVVDMFPSWYEPSAAAGIETAVIDTVSKKLAINCTPERARQEVTSVGLRAEIPPDDPAFYRWNPPVQALAKSLGLGSGGAIPTEKDDVHKCSDDPPKVELTAEVDGDEIEVVADVEEGTFDVQSVEITYNGQVIKKCGNDGECKVDYEPSGSGTYNFKVTVIDKGLYDATDTTSVEYEEDEDNSFLPGPPGFAGVMPGRDRNGPNG